MMRKLAGNLKDHEVKPIRPGQQGPRTHPKPSFDQNWRGSTVDAPEYIPGVSGRDSCLDGVDGGDPLSDSADPPSPSRGQLATKGKLLTSKSIAVSHDPEYFGEESHTVTRIKSIYAIDPKKKVFHNWDFLMLNMLLYTATITPYEVAFLEPAWDAMFVCNRIVDVCFLTDIILNLFIAYFDGVSGTWVYDLRLIRKRYIKGWFAMDVVSVLPFDLLHEGKVTGSYLQTLRILKMVRLLRLVKLLRILRIGRIFRRIESSLSLDYSLIELLKFCSTTLLLSHWIACAFGMIEALEAESETWLSIYFCRNFERPPPDIVLASDGESTIDFHDSDCDKENIHVSERYVAALYWAVTSLTTIGYGDIVAQNSTEHVFMLFVMLLGAFQYGYIIGALGGVLAMRDVRKNRYIELMTELNCFMDECKFPIGFRLRLREYFRYRFTSTDVKHYHKVLQALSPKLRGEVSMLADNQWIKQVELFRNCPQKFLVEVAMRISQQTYPPLESIFNEGDEADTMFVVKKGLLLFEGKIYRRWDSLKDESLYQVSIHEDRCVTITFADVWMIQKDSLDEVVAKFPPILKQLRWNSLKKLFRREVMAYAVAVRACEDPALKAVLLNQHENQKRVMLSPMSPLGRGSFFKPKYSVDRSLHYLAKVEMLLKFTVNETAFVAIQQTQIRYRLKYQRRKEAEKRRKDENECSNVVLLGVLKALHKKVDNIDLQISELRFERNSTLTSNESNGRRPKFQSQRVA
ncbi:hypothetical protein CYMTET_49426 [Cymbomonas tetramitiformis]|uniref:Cyclic nucleotide-binding domain-containing protein n=1 Tax=Cymbomonas tetramitiformis TaxID=36881 RepID=A0AAE0BQ84_9CHLO|nr:hypothetical protein CYMTET_49426 [Cymbomonas tetramitiformis]